ncbi:hypothetical protein KW803_00470 [Candidatus Saccharibacteria bacterium]|nr:hypothetical protein [Candidatus Saccharibacteria bacterium]
MREKINEKVSVVSYYSSKRHKFLPYQIHWKNHDYTIGELGMAHKYKNGDTWHHIFEVTDKEQTLSFRLNFNTQELSWMLEVISDGQPS